MSGFLTTEGILMPRRRTRQLTRRKGEIMVYRRFMVGLAILTLGAGVLGGCKKEAPEKEVTPQAAPEASPEQASTPGNEAQTDVAKTGEELFKQYCIACHAEGGNTINPEKTLHKKSLEASGVATVDAIIGKMRKPGPGMPKFDEKTISDKDAKAIAEYVLKTF
jgi:cytochrome c6